MKTTSNPRKLVKVTLKRGLSITLKSFLIYRTLNLFGLAIILLFDYVTNKEQNTKIRIIVSRNHHEKEPIYSIKKRCHQNKAKEHIYSLMWCNNCVVKIRLCLQCFLMVQVTQCGGVIWAFF